MKFHMSRRLFLPAAFLCAVAVFAAAFFLALAVRSVVADPDAPNPGHSWSEIGLPVGTWPELDADLLDGLNSDQIQDADDHVSSADDADTVDGLHANEIHDADDYVSNAGYATTAGDADTVDGLHANQIHDADDYVSNAGYATTAGDADTVDGQHASAFAGASHIHDDRYYTETELQTSGFASLHWDNLSSVPAGFADDVDNDILGGLSCANGEIAKWDGSAWQCATDDTGTGSFWSLSGNSGTTPGTDFLGTTDNQALELHVNSSRALRLEPDATSPNIIGGYSGNSVTSGVYGATIGGGGESVYTNRVTDDYGTIGGGGNNQAGDNAGTTSNHTFQTVGGGLSNTASSDYATVGGGYQNFASGYTATVPGGNQNTAAGSASTVGGGMGNDASSDYATVGGGRNNHVSAAYATIAGGGSATPANGNLVTDEYGTVGGGEDNLAGDDAGATTDAKYATVGGGLDNAASGRSATVGGGESNTAGTTAEDDYATVGGGHENTASASASTVAGGHLNTASAGQATVGGGWSNSATALMATVGGGWLNTASGYTATVGGGYNNDASGDYATVPGGSGNDAAGDYSFAAGRRAKANNQGCFVWADSTDADFTCGTNDRFMVRASGGVELYSTSDLSDWVKIYDDATDLITTSTGGHLTTGGAWTDSSDAAMKQNFTPVDGQEVLASLAEMPVTTWNHKAEDASIRHMGPTAQDFYAAFGLGTDDKSIASLDTSGVALAAIQGLYELSQEQAQRIDDLEARVAALEGGAPLERGSQSLLASIMPFGPLFLAGLLVVGGLAVVERRRAGGRS